MKIEMIRNRRYMRRVNGWVKSNLTRELRGKKQKKINALHTVSVSVNLSQVWQRKAKLLYSVVCISYMHLII